VLSRTEAAQRVRASAIRSHLVAALDDWAYVQGKSVPGDGALLQEVADLADDDPWTRQLRAAVGRGDRAALERLAEEAPPNQAPIHLQRLGRALVNVGSGAAVQLLGRAQREHPADFWINYELAIALAGYQADRGTIHSVHYLPSQRDHPRLAQAIRFDQAALALRPQSPAAHANLGVDLLDQGKPAEAEVALRKAIQLKPDYAEAHANLCAALYEQGKRAEAEATCREAIRLKPAFAEAHSNLGTALFAQGKLAEAETAFRQAIQLKPDYAVAHNNLGIALRAQGKPVDAEAVHRQAIQLKPDYAKAYCDLGRALLDQGKRAEAEAAWREAIRLAPALADAYINLGFLLHAQRRLAEAEAAYRKASQLQPENPTAHNNLGNTLWDQGKLAEAEAECRAAIRLKPDYAEAHNNLANALRDQGKLAESERACRTAIRLKPDYVAAHLNLGNALRARMQLGAAIDAFRMAISLDPKFANAHGALGETLLQLGRFAEAREASRRCLELLQPDQPLRQLVRRQLQQCEQGLTLDQKLPAILEGKAESASAAESLALAQLCQQPYKKCYAAACRLYAQAFAGQPKLADDLNHQHRYNAACAAALAGCGQGKDADKLDPKERDRLRRQALDWLRADLKAFRELTEKAADKASPAVGQRMQHWLEDDDLAGVRAAESLARLQEMERKDWQKLWQEVEALRQHVARRPKTAATVRP
jgi:superkiller protein 3